ncbi:hypothetical protein SLA2020_170420 [Shorea laevis]
MVSIFEKKVERNIENEMRLPEDSLWRELPPDRSLPTKLKVKDERNTTWSFDYSKKHDRPCLSGADWRNFVQSRVFEAGNIKMITLCKNNDPCPPGDTFYEIKLSN